MRTFSSGERMPPRITRGPSASRRAGTPSDPSRSRRRRGSTGCSGGAASPASTLPRTSPNSRNASSAYCEQLGWYLHVPAGVSSPNVHRHAWTSPMPRYFTRAPSRGPRRSPRRASPSRASRPARRGRARREHVVLPARDRREELAPRLAQQPLHAVPCDRGADGARHRETEPRLAVGIVVAREPVQDEVPTRRRAATPVDGVEVLRPGEPVAALHRCVSGREALAAPRAAALEDRAASARGHSRSEPMTPLAAADVRLIGAFHVVSAGSGAGSREYRRLASHPSFPQRRKSRGSTEIAAHRASPLSDATTLRPSSTPVDRGVDGTKVPAK